jgi:hypothetical protein
MVFPNLTNERRAAIVLKIWENVPISAEIRYVILEKPVKTVLQTVLLQSVVTGKWKVVNNVMTLLILTV